MEPGHVYDTSKITLQVKMTKRKEKRMKPQVIRIYIVVNAVGALNIQLKDFCV